jgi:hypothetical protein
MARRTAEALELPRVGKAAARHHRSLTKEGGQRADSLPKPNESSR